MRREFRRAIAGIIEIQPYIYGIESKIEKEQEKVIADMTSPAEKVVKKLIELDNRRIDLCNLKVLYAFMEKGLGADFALFKTVVLSNADSKLYDRAEEEIKRVGYDAGRALKEFGYLFKSLKRRAKPLVKSAVGVFCNA